MTGMSDIDHGLDGTAGATDDESTEDESSGGDGLFDDLVGSTPVFEDKEVLRPSYTPRELPHRTAQIDQIASVLASGLRGDTPSNILIYGKTGTGKTACAKYVSEELEATAETGDVPCEVAYINCEVTDTQYRVLAQLANRFVADNRRVLQARLGDLETLRDRVEVEGAAALADSDLPDREALAAAIEELRADRARMEEVPMTGWPTDRVYDAFFEAVDYRERVVVVMLDEIDKLVEKSGDDTLYNLSRMNADLDNSRVSIMGISNDLQFTDFLDPRVKSSLGEEEIVFPPYDATQLQDILQQRAAVAFREGVLAEEVIPLCGAFAAREHGDARRALDLLRTAGELAARDGSERVGEGHVREAQEELELDRVTEVVRTLPRQSQLVLYAIVRMDEKGMDSITTGEVYGVYEHLCEHVSTDALTQRRVTDLIGELDMLGLVNAVVVSKGRYGRTKEICLSAKSDATARVLRDDAGLATLESVDPFVQQRFDV